jgi:hypothetical protein
MLLSFDYIGYKRLSENKRFPNHRWYSDATWGGGGGGGGSYCEQISWRDIMQ